jgi:hypothetical protein
MDRTMVNADLVSSLDPAPLRWRGAKRRGSRGAWATFGDYRHGGMITPGAERLLGLVPLVVPRPQATPGEC